MFINEKRLNQVCGKIIALLSVLIIAFYFIAGDALFYREAPESIQSVTGNAATPEIVEGVEITQDFYSNVDYLDGFTIRLATYARENQGTLEVSLMDLTTNENLVCQIFDISQLEDSVFTQITVPEDGTIRKGHYLQIKLKSNDCIAGNAVAAWYGAGVVSQGQMLKINSEEINGTLCFDTWGRDQVWTGSHYWIIMVPLLMLISLYLINVIWKNKQRKVTLLTYIINVLDQYRFLIKQLVARDFKVKYKRSFLGAIWSFLNPLLTMSVQYMVFSTVFKSDIEYYPVYLLSGIVLFNFFQEATNSALYSIVGNASLITKVYVPKYIYPLTKVLSSTVNLVISLLPLIIMIVLTGVPIQVSYILFIYVLVNLLIFSVGVGFVLSSAMVFFRDIQFIWSVISLLWMYATPIFYPESIFPEQFLVVLKFNPLYYFIKFARMTIIEGVSPEPKMYLICMGFSLVSIIIGVFVFKRTQDKFILYV